MYKLIILICLMLSAKTVLCQFPPTLFGKWEVLELNSDRVYKNFENDSIYFYFKEEQDKYQTDEIKTQLNEGFKIIPIISFILNPDSTVLFEMFGNMEKGKYTFDSNLSSLIIDISDKADTLKLTPLGLFEFDLSDEYENVKLTFKRNSK